MHCPICNIEMIADYKIKVENYLLFNMVTIKKGSDTKKSKGSILSFLRQNRIVH